MTITSRVATAIILLVLFIQHTGGFQRKYAHDDSSSDDTKDAGFTHDENSAGT